MLWKRVATLSAPGLLSSSPPVVRHSGGSRGVKSRRMIPMWDRVLPSFWHPMVSLEQSLLDMEELTRLVFAPHFPPFPPDTMPKLHEYDDEFFKDLPVKASHEAAEKKTDEAKGDKDPSNTKPKGETARAAEAGTGTPRPAYSSYSYSYSTVLDSGGHRIGTTRRRYEDSTGRLKALHQREMDDKKLKTWWKRVNKADNGEHRTECTSGDVDAFEKEWAQTPFGLAEDERETNWLDESEKSIYQAFGIDYNPVQPTDKELEELTAEDQKTENSKMEDKERAEAIEKASKRQEEETTPPQYT
ncbi:hypothetical protein BBJ28_00010412 [Nothophytophthora sp. Chile5]|nr:hypothetical protein BBJ28_00010412 [Nothophytophthora sp. Chile5]